jgi:hypothetical protein
MVNPVTTTRGSTFSVRRVARLLYRNMLLTGAACLPDTFDTQEERLTEKGFLAMYEAMLAAQDDDDAFYTNFEQLGYNRRLELDEVCCFSLAQL